MSVIKPAGLPPAYSDPQRRDVREGLLQVSRMKLDAALDAAKAAAVATAAAELGALGDVRGLSAEDYAKAKKAALRAVRGAERKP